MTDIFSQYRKPAPAGNQTASSSSDGPEQYVAYATGHDVKMMRIIISPELDHSPSSSILLDVTSDHRKGTYFVIVYSILAVEVFGLNLDPVVRAIRGGAAKFIQAYHSSRWPKPVDESAPFISEIKVHFNEKGSKLTQSNEY
jgi:hypothetical protein